MNKQKWLSILVWVMVMSLLFTSLITIFLLVEQRDAIGTAVNKAVESHIEKLDIKDGSTPRKGTDYFDGQSATPKQIEDAVSAWLSQNPPQAGQRGASGENGRDATQEQVDRAVREYMEAKPPEDGLTPLLQCNTEKNRWEVKYHPDDNWQLLNGEKVPCTVKE